MVTFDKNTADAITAARSVLLEVSHVLGEYRDNIVVIGGWVSELIVSKDHLGSLDVDLDLDHRKISDECYRSIQELWRFLTLSSGTLCSGVPEQSSITCSQLLSALGEKYFSVSESDLGT